jgi:uncharacterized protein YndB with AHSA1/START domain
MDTIGHEVWIKAEAPTVFDALTTQDGLDGWWGKAVSAEPEVGHVVEFDHGHGAPVLMRIIELVPNERVVRRCVSDHTNPGHPGSDWLGTDLSFTLSSAEDDPLAGWLSSALNPEGSPRDITILRFDHTGWKRGARWFAFCNGAWGATLNDNLLNYCQTSGERRPQPA